jgi:beta-glucosidase/6-phospho-beta-glucosidase/beta-galactosidase
MPKKKQTEETTKSTAKTKKTRRSKHKYPGLMKQYTSKIRREYLDQDYIDKLSDEEKKWLSNFNEEWLGANFNHDGKVLHRTKEEKREIYNRNNARNRDLISQMNAQNKLVATDKVKEMLEKEELHQHVNPESVEDALIMLIDEKRNEEK